MSQPAVRDAERDSGYGIRRFRADDVGAFLELHRAVSGRDLGRARFAWKYEDNPYVYHVPVFVAVADGELVGAQPFFALCLSVNGQRHLALQRGETLVHPDHRGAGLPARMNEAAGEAYSDGDVSFLFDFSDPESTGGAPDPEWEFVAEHPTYYRVHDPAALLGSLSAWTSIATRALRPVVEGYNRLSNRRVGAAEGVSVKRYDSVPSATLASIEYDRRKGGVQVLRDVRFYDWRFDDPAREHTAFVAERAGEPIAGLVVETEPDDGTVATVSDVTPLPRERAVDGLETLLCRVVSEYDDAGLLVAPPALPRDLAGRAGFRSDDRWPLSRACTRRNHAVLELADGSEFGGVDVADADSWRLTFAEQDAG